MIKKKLGLLAGSVMVATSANAAIDLGTEGALAIFNTAGAGTFIQALGVSGTDLSTGTAFSIDVAAASAALGGTIDSFAVLGLADATCTGLGCYNYSETLYVSGGGGLVYTAGAAASTTNLAAFNAVNAIQSYLDVASFGLNNEGTAGDADGNGFANTYLTSGTASLGFNVQNAGASSSSTYGTVGEDAAITGSTFSNAAAVPVPAAAWLFGSALLGLGVVRRKK
jgi:hypothetical protein